MKPLRHHIAVIGGNFAGLTAAIKLSKRHAVTVIDPSAHFEWMPNIHEILSSVKTPQGLRLDRAAIVEQAGHRFLQDRVTELHPARKRLRTAGGHELSFDACIVAVGARWNTHDIPGVDRHALPCRSIADAVLIEQRLRTLVQQGRPLHIVIVGGGISGIEALGEILRRYRDVPSLSVEVVEAGERLLPGLPPVLDADLRRLCHPHAVQFHTGARIASVSAKGVHLDDGTRLHSELTLWTAGLTAPELLQQSGLARPPHIWADVHQTLQSRHASRTFVIGDSAQLPNAVPKQAYNAIDMGELAAINVIRLLEGAPLKPYQPSSKPVLIAFGDLDTYMVAGRTVLASQALAGAKEGVFQLFMTQMAPCDVLKSLPAVGERLWQSWRRLAWPQLLTLTDFRKLPDRRVVRVL
ncbi:MAG: FAD-dependent oxidoreductase [Rubrivivax sp.]|nr:FAD-dependent oxidoreductase [Rubrivivax sp.]